MLDKRKNVETVLRVLTEALKHTPLPASKVGELAQDIAAKILSSVQDIEVLQRVAVLSFNLASPGQNAYVDGMFEALFWETMNKIVQKNKKEALRAIQYIEDNAPIRDGAKSMMAEYRDDILRSRK